MTLGYCTPSTNWIVLVLEYKSKNPNSAWQRGGELQFFTVPVLYKIGHFNFVICIEINVNRRLVASGDRFEVQSFTYNNKIVFKLKLCLVKCKMPETTSNS